MTIPDNILAAVNALLAPYGESYTPGGKTDGYLSIKDAAKYLGISKPMLYKLVKQGSIERIKLGDGIQGKAVISRQSLDAYIASRRV